MSGFPEKLLLCTNGSAHTLPALEYGAYLATTLDRPIILLGIVEDDQARTGLQKLLEDTLASMHWAGIQVESIVREGRAEAVIADEAARGDSLTIVGPLGRPLLWRLARGSSFRELLAAIATPILLVPKVRLPLRCILICTGGLPYATTLEHLAIFLARAANASVTLLHVVEPVTFDYRLAREVEAHWQTLLETDTPQARNLLAAQEEATRSGVEVAIRIRRGNPIREILRELRSGDYDMVGLGSPYSAHSLRHLLMPNVTAEVAEAAHCPVLSVRFAHAGEEPEADRQAGEVAE